MFSVLVINGPNLNLLGTREPELYGHATLVEIDAMLLDYGRDHNIQVETYQSNMEGEIIDTIQQSKVNDHQAIIINAASLTHTSIGIRDALIFSELPYVEVHLSNVYARESFRHQSMLSDQAQAVLCGMGAYGYQCALEFIVKKYHH